MRWTPAAPLMLLFLTAAAAPSGPCGPAADIRQFDGADAIGTLGFPAFSAMESKCEGGGILPSIPQTAGTGNASRDVLHGLPSPDALRPVDQPWQAPVLR